MTVIQDPPQGGISHQAPRDYVWLVVTIFSCFILSLTAVFCGLGVWATQNEPASTAESSTSKTSTPNAPDVDSPGAADPERSWKLLIDDEFNDNKNEWTVGPYQNDGLTLQRTIEDGHYTWDYQAEQGWHFWGFPDIVPIAQDFIATVDIKHIEGNAHEGFGLIVRAQDQDFYLLEITEDGYVYFEIHTHDKYQTLMEHSTSTIRSGLSNRVRLKAIGPHFTFYINGEKVGEIEDDRLKEGFVGMFTSTNRGDGPGIQAAPIFAPNVGAARQSYASRYEVDNFKVWIPTTGPALLETLTPQKGTILFVSDKDGNPEIYLIHTDGTHVKRLTDDPADDLSPKWSSDDGRIAFVSSRDGNPEIYIMRSDGTEIKRVTQDLSNDLDPAWSADGKCLLFASNRDGNYEIYITDLESGTTERLTDNISDDRYPDWSSAGNLIVYQSTKYGIVTLYLIDRSTGQSDPISLRIQPYAESHPSFSADGTQIIYTSGSAEGQTGLMTYDVKSRKNSQVIGQSLDVTNDYHSNLSPSWSADGSQITFTSSRKDATDIYIISIDGKSIFRVTHTSAAESDLDWSGN